MLNKKTKVLMKAVYENAITNNGVCLVSQLDLLEKISYTINFSRNDLEPSLKALMLEGYFEIIESEKKGEKYYCITLLQAGYDFSRQIAAEKRAIKFKIIMTVAGTIAAYILTQILAAIFK